MVKLMLILMAGLCLRLYGIDHQSFNVEEWQTLNFITHFSYHQLAFDIIDASNFPFYFLLVKATAGLLGISEFTLRLPSLIFSTLSIWLLYKLGEAFSSKGVGLMAALLLVFSPFSILYAQTARSYSLLSFLGLLVLYFFVRYCQTHKTICLIGFLVVSFLGLATHGLFSPFLLSIGLFLILELRRIERQNRLKLFAGLILLLFAVLFVLWPRYLAAFSFRHLNFLPESELFPIKTRILLAFFGLTLGETTSPFNWVVVLPAAFFFGIAFVGGFYFSLRKQERWISLVLLTFFCSFIFWLILKTHTVRYMNTALPLFLLIVSFGLHMLFDRRVWKSCWLVFMVIPQIASASHWYAGNASQVLDANLLIPWEEIVSDIGSRCKSDERVLIHPHFFNDVDFQYYKPKCQNHYTYLPERGYENSIGAVLRQKPNTLWVLSLSRNFREDKIQTDYFRCYRILFRKGYVRNPSFEEYLKTGVKTFAYAAKLYHLKRDSSHCGPVN